MRLHRPTLFFSLFVISLQYMFGCGGPPAQQTVPEVNLVTVQDGEDAIQKGDYEGAKEIFSQLLTESPNDPTLRYYLGLCKDNLGDLEGAVSDYQKALSLNAEFTDARLNLGLVYFKQNNLDAAIAEFEAVAQAEPDASDVQYNLAMVLEAAGKIDDARVHYVKSAELDGEDPEPVIALGDLEKAAGNTSAALDYYAKAETIGAGSAVAVLSAAQLLAEQKKLDAAAKKILTLTEMETDAETLASAGIMLSKMKKTDDAITIYTHTIEVFPQYTKAYILLGNALARTGKFKEAKTQFEKVIEIAPDSTDAATATQGIAACEANLKK
ncbi:MAG: tetratricopeptide repeat protein [Deltaproteobacteria bacterium]|nr:tetratricopeptide repeat protein [Deltaproteobacteria bacterium]MBN2673378.1 tetratricopeptide repeat protein [Deltaproteobacteria bacterium]